MCFRPATVAAKVRICLVCGNANPQVQANCLKCGADMSSVKSVEFMELPSAIGHTHSKAALGSRNGNFKQQPDRGSTDYPDETGENTGTEQRTDYDFRSIIGESKEIERARELARRFATSSANVLLIGESGTGKELFAQAIHSQSRPAGPLMGLNCAAIPRTLLESELFGYDGGAFTGAKKNGSAGKIELAHEGTLFLDEIGDMPMETQAVLLRVLESKQVMRLGGRKYQKVDFRLIAATNKDLQLMVDEGTFRLDLYYRLSVLRVHIPPLRQRERDVITLAEFFLNKHGHDIDKIPEIAMDTQLKLMEYNWPGNVRQLENGMIHALHVCDDHSIRPEHLPVEIINSRTAQQERKTPAPAKSEDLKEIVSSKEAEEIVIQNALTKAGNNIAIAAYLLGISKSTLYRKLKLLKVKK